MTDTPQSAIRGIPGRGFAVWFGYPLLLLLTTGILGVLNIPIREHLSTDQMSLGTMALARIDPELFASDTLYSNEAHYAFYLPWYRSVVFAFCNWSGGIAWGFWLAMMCLTAASLLISYVMFVGLNVRSGLAFAGAVLVCLPRLTVGETLWGAGMIQTVLPRTFFCVGFPLVVLLLLRSSFRGWSVPAAFLGIGLLGNLHPQSGLYAAGILGILLLIVRRFERSAWLALALAGFCALVGVLPFVIESAWWLTKVETGPTDEVSAAASQALAQWCTRKNSAATGSLVSNLGPKLIVFGVCVAPILLATGLCRALTDWNRNRHLKVAAVATGLVLVFVVSTVIAKNLLINVWVSWLTRITWLRACRFVPFFGVTAIVLALNEVKGVSTGRGRLLKLILVGLALMPVGASVAGMEYIYRTRFHPYRQVAQWAAKTPKGTRFVAPPHPAIAFRLWSRRPVAIAEHDISFLYISFPQKFLNAVEVATQLSDAYESKDWKAIRNFAQRHNIRYAVGPAEMKAVMEPVFLPDSGPGVFFIGPARQRRDGKDR